eukprot:762572-Prorocentrum_minimum.AAC.2
MCPANFYSELDLSAAIVELLYENSGKSGFGPVSGTQSTSYAIDDGRFTNCAELARLTPPALLERHSQVVAFIIRINDIPECKKKA